VAKPQRKCAKILGKTNMRSKRSIILVGYPPLYRHYMARLSFEKRDIFSGQISIGRRIGELKNVRKQVPEPKGEQGELKAKTFLYSAATPCVEKKVFSILVTLLTSVVNVLCYWVDSYFC